MFEWDPELYSRFLKERTQPAIDLASRIGLKEPNNAIDIGCGPGNSTRVLADRYPHMRVTGADYSEHMLTQARANHPELEFIRFDAGCDFPSIRGRYNIVFSNACIQWLPNHQHLLPEMMSALTVGGVLAVQVPVNFDEPIHRIIQDVVHSAKWRGQLEASRSLEMLTESEYFDILSQQTTDFSIWKTVYMHRMPSHASIMDWYRGTGLRPYLDRLSESDAADFERDILSEVVKAYPVQQNGEIIFRFPRLFFTAVREG